MKNKEFELDLNHALFQPNVKTANEFFVKYEMKSLIKELNSNNNHSSENTDFKPIFFPLKFLLSLETLTIGLTNSPSL